MRNASRIRSTPPIQQKSLQQQQAIRLPVRLPARIAPMLTKKALIIAAIMQAVEKPTPRPAAMLSKESAMPREAASGGVKRLSLSLLALSAWLSQERSKSLISPRTNRIANPAILVNKGGISPMSRFPANREQARVPLEIAERMIREEKGIFTRFMP